MKSSRQTVEGPRFVRHTGIAAPFLWPNVNADVIAPINPNEIPGLSQGERAFEGIRYFPDGRERPDFVLNQEPYRRASILVVGRNFGTGSARGTAVSRPMAMGFRVVIGSSFGPFFYTNTIRQGFLAAAVDEATVQRIADWVQSNPGVEMTVDLERTVIEIPGLAPITFQVDARVRNKFLNGLADFDEIQQYTGRVEELRSEDRARRPWVYVNATGAGP